MWSAEPARIPPMMAFSIHYMSGFVKTEEHLLIHDAFLRDLTGNVLGILCRGCCWQQQCGLRRHEPPLETFFHLAWAPRVLSETLGSMSRHFDLHV
jgi:hypothetical protein